VLAYGAIGASHGSGLKRTAILAFHAGAVHMHPGGGLEAAIAVRSGTAVNAALFIMIVLMKPVDALGTAWTIIGRAAINTFCSHNHSS